MTEHKAAPAAWWHRKGDQFANAKPSGDRPLADVWEPLFDQAALDAAVAAERERCAKVCEHNAHTFARHVAEIIRQAPAGEKP